MSIGTLVGLLFGFGLFFGSIILSTNNYFSFIDGSSFLMVFGGTMAASFISYQSRYVVLALKGIGNMLKKPEASHETLNKEIMQLIKWGYVVQQKGLIALEDEAKATKITNPVLRFGADLIITGYKPEEMRPMMENAVESTYERDMVTVEVLKSMSGTAPAFGMIGTLVGLIIMLQSLGDDLSKLGQGLAIALLTTLYGVVLARLVFLPAALKLEQKVEIVRFRNVLIAEAMVMLSEKQSPRFMQDMLNSYLDRSIHFDIDRQL